MSDNSVVATADEPVASDETAANEDALWQEVELTAKEIDTKMEQIPTLEADVEAILREHLQKPITPTTLSNLGSSLEFYVGSENAGQLVSLLSSETLEPSMLDKLQGIVSPQTLRWMRRLLAIYGKSMQDAYITWRQNPEGWKDGDRRASFDIITGIWWVSLKIEKYNGSVAFVEDTPSKMVSLAQRIIETIATITPAHLKEDLPVHTAIAFRSAVDKLFEVIELDREAEEAEPTPAAENHEANQEVSKS